MTKNTMKRTLAGLTAVLSLAGSVPASVIANAQDLESSQLIQNQQEENVQLEDFEWASDYSTATAKFSDGSSITTAATKTILVDGPCDEGRKVQYSVTISYKGITVDKNQVVEFNEHNWELVEWHWLQDNIAVATVKCSECGEEKGVVAVITTEIVEATCEEPGSVTTVATATIDGQEFVDKKTSITEPIDHEWVDASQYSYTWVQDEKGNYTGCTAKRACKHDASHVDSCEAELSYEVILAPTIKNKGVGRYTAKFSNSVFETQYKTVEIAAENPKYAAAVYTWSDDNSKCTAFADCLNGTDEDDIIEVVDTTSEVTLDPTCTEKGKTTYTAEFTNNLFTTKTKEVDNIDALGHDYGEPEWDWDEDEDGNPVATAIFTCSRGDSVVEVEDNNVTVLVTKKPTCEAEGQTVYTAEVTFGGEKYNDTKIVTTDPIGHNWKAQFFWGDDNTAVALITCTNCGECEACVADIKVTRVEPTCTSEGKITYTAYAYVGDEEFTDEVSYKIEKLPHEYGEAQYTWTKDEENDTYTCKAVLGCIHCDDEITEDGKVSYEVKVEPTVSSKGVGVYTATFDNEVFTTSTYEVAIATIKANYGDPVYEWSEDYSTCTATRKCLNGTAADDIVEKADATSEITREATCGAKGQTTYTAVFKDTDDFEVQTKTVDNIDTLPHTMGEPIWSWVQNGRTYTATVKTICSVCGDVETYPSEVTSSLAGGIVTYTATATIDGTVYTSTLNVSAQLVYKNPVVTYEKGDECVKLKWNEVDGAESYAVFGYISGKWQSLAQGNTTSYVLKNLTPGQEYKVAVIARFNGVWNTSDMSNAITVTPNATSNKYPTATAQVQGSAFKLDWTAVPNAQAYAIGYYTAGKWRVLQQVSGTTTTFVKTKVPAGSYKVVVVAKVGGNWDTSNLNQRATTVTIK